MMRNPLALLILAALAAPGCDSSPSAAADRPAAPRAAPPVPVKTASAVREDFSVTAAAIGWVEPYATVTVRPQVSGQLLEIRFNEGDDLVAGQILFLIDPRPFDIALQLARAARQRDAALASDAQREAERTQRLFEASQASERERDQTRFAADSRAAQLAADDADIRKAELDLEYCTIRAPLAGRAGRYVLNAGNIVKADDTDLVTINQLTPIYVVFSLPEHQLGRLRDAMREGTVRVSAESDGDPQTGALTFVDNQVDRETGMIRIKAAFDNADHGFWPGRFARVSLSLQTLRDTVVVPDTAVQSGQGFAFVYVVASDNTAQLKRVEPGPTVENRTAILRGLSGGETVVTDGHLRLTPGATVHAAAEPASAPASAPGATATRKAAP